MIRSVSPQITAESIRDDLDHIHNLVVIETMFANGNACVSLNSVHNSLFARTCMRSRGKYKGMQIEYYTDECAAPLPVMANLPKKENVPVVSVMKLNPMANRFQALNIDESEDGEGWD